VVRLRKEMRGVYQWYTGRKSQEPSNLDAIATMEMNSVINSVKHEYNNQFAQHNSDIGDMRKSWRQNKHLSKEPRIAHDYVNGRTIALAALFNVPVMVKGAGGRWIRKGWEKMSHPHAAGASPGQVINCHCSCDYVFTLKKLRGPELEELPRKRQLQTVKPKRIELAFKCPVNSQVWKTGRKLEGRIDFQGLAVSVENKKGSKRSGTDSDGHNWETTMKYPYGYILRSEGADGEHVDCYVGDERDSDRVFIVHQNNPETGEYDEDKVMLGFESPEDAKQAYLEHYDRPGFFGTMDEMSMDDFRELLGKEKDQSAGIRPEFLTLALHVETITKAALPVGHISTHADGTKWKKQPDGSWRQVTKPGEEAPADKPEEKPVPAKKASIANLQGDFDRVKAEMGKLGGSTLDLRNRFEAVLSDMSENYTKEYFIGKDGKEYHIVMDLNAKGKYWIIDASDPDALKLVGEKENRDFDLAAARDKLAALGAEKKDSDRGCRREGTEEDRGEGRGGPGTETD
jgi:hypothetical protein